MVSILLMTRNQQITDSVLAGESLASIGSQHGICASRASQIVLKHCRMHQPELYARARKLSARCPDFKGLARVSDLRKVYKDTAKDA